MFGSKIHLGATLLSLLFASSLNAQLIDDIPDRPILKISTLGLFNGQYQVALEKKRTDFVTFQGSLGLIAGTRRFLSDADSNQKIATLVANKTGVIFIPEVRYFFKGAAPHGGYLACFFRFRYSSENQKDNSLILNPKSIDYSRVQHLTSIGSGFSLGYQKATKKIILDIFAGMLFNHAAVRNNFKTNTVSEDLFVSKFTGYRNLDRSGAGLRFGFMVGFRI